MTAPSSLPTVVRVTCPYCSRRTAAYRQSYRGPLIMIVHHRPDRPVIAFLKRLLPWTSEPWCEGSEQEVQP